MTYLYGLGSSFPGHFSPWHLQDSILRHELLSENDDHAIYIPMWDLKRTSSLVHARFLHSLGKSTNICFPLSPLLLGGLTTLAQ